MELRSLCARCDGHPPYGQVELQRGGVLHLQGDVADALFLVVEGVLCETHVTEDGRGQGIRLVQPGDATGSEAMVRDEYQCSVEALTRARVCRIPVSDVEARMQDEPSQGPALCRVLASELVGLRDQVMAIGAMTAEERVEAVLRTLTSHAAAGAWVRLPLTRGELGELLSLAQGTVSRCIQRMARAGTLEVRGRRVRFLDR
ncbi:MAG: Crp/Fnr family transcriptional regulator [Myxococcota bacterium]